MKRAIAWFAQNPVAANLMMILIIVWGGISLSEIRQKTFPDIDVDVIRVGVPYLGAAPEEVEKGVCVRIEEALQGIAGVERLSSSAAEGACGVSVEVLSGTSVERALAEVKNAIDGITTFPNETETPTVSHFELKRNALQIALSGDADEQALRHYGERLRDGISALPGVTQVALGSVRDYEVSIELPEQSLRRYGITFDDVVAAVRSSSLDLPGGAIKAREGEILLRSKGQAYAGTDFEDIVVLTREDGTRLYLGDVANVVDGFEESDRFASFNGEPAVLVQVFRVGDQKILELTRSVKAFVAEFESELPAGLSLTVWRDDSVYLTDRLRILLGNAEWGFVLVFVVLAFFLRLRLAFWVAIGVPISVMGALALFPVWNFSIDVLTLFAFILVLGLLVDDAIVVGENIHSHQERAEDPLRASIRGAQEVSVPVIFGVLTTVAAFLPMVIAPGPMGAFFGTIGMVVIFCLFFSVVESQLVLPSHLGHRSNGVLWGLLAAGAAFLAFWAGGVWLLGLAAVALLAGVLFRGFFFNGPRRRVGRRRAIQARWKRIQQFMGESLARVSREAYRPLLDRAIASRYVTVTIAVALLVVTFAAVGTGRVRWIFFPSVEGDYVSASVTMAPGAPVERTAAAVALLEASAREMAAEFDLAFGVEGSVVKHAMSVVGGRVGLDRGGPNTGSEAGTSNQGEVSLELVGGGQRRISPRELVARWRELTPPILEADEVAFVSDYFSFGEPINIQLQSASSENLEVAAERLKKKLADYPGVFDVTDSFQGGKAEMRLDILPGAEALGLSMGDLARQVRQAFYGEEIQRIQRGRNDIRVMVRFPEEQRRSVADLENLRIRAPSGGEVPFYAVANAEMGRGYATIRRVDRQRVINVSSDIDQTRGNVAEILRDLNENFFPSLVAEFPDVRYSLEGEQREQQRMFEALARDYVFAMVLIYALLAVPLRSYGQPLIIMAVIPFGLVGAIGGHLIMGMDFSMMSLFGVVALSGVVVNSSLVLVHSVNRRRDEGVVLFQAVTEAGVSRFRPIVLTSLTTFAGLSPLLFEKSMGAQFVIPMAVSLAFGVVFATGISLLVVPCSYVILDDITKLFRRGASSAGSGRSGKDAGASLGDEMAAGPGL